VKIVCATSVAEAEAAFATIGDVVMMPEERITRTDLVDADALITRSKLRIDEALLRDTPVRFIGCAVAGVDHVDWNYVEQTDIFCTHAPGCNARSVAEYVVTALLLEADRHGLALDHCTLGIIGVGHIGSQVAELATALGLTVLLNDPPRAAAEGSAQWDFLELEDLLGAADLVTLHVPYTQTGPYATRHLLNHRFLEQLPPGALLVNAARGEIMDSEAVLTALAHGHLRQAVLDVWENEPAIRADVLERVDIATPHIAGYSWQGRLNGTQMVYDACCRFFELDPFWNSEDVPGPSMQPVEINARDRSPQEVLTELALTAYPILRDDQMLRAGADTDPVKMGRHFQACRRDYPVRHEFGSHRFTLSDATPAVADMATTCGFQICA
jgi:erythronate-4-phosphate dehydrogenase